MYKQIDMFDFIPKPEKHRTLLERLLEKTNNPLIPCTNCLCGYCVNNVEDLWAKVKPEEQRKPCFKCDECRYYTGKQKNRTQRIEDCEEFVISNYAAASRRKKIKEKK